MLSLSDPHQETAVDLSLTNEGDKKHIKEVNKNKKHVGQGSVEWNEIGFAVKVFDNTKSTTCIT